MEKEIRDLPLFHVNILTLFPEMFPGTLGYSLPGKALMKNIWSYNTINIRDFAIGKHAKVDAPQYGGGPGLVLRADVLAEAIDYALESYKPQRIYYMSSRGQVLKQNMTKKIIKDSNILIICGRFEGVDERLLEEYNITEISIGDFILFGGEVAALVTLEACIRMLPQVVKNEQTLQEESFNTENLSRGLLDHPVYTIPRVWREREVPEVLVSGDHQKIKDWRYQQSLKVTKRFRPDLLNKETKN